jgi:DNA-3-methyladenine glycosylase II
MNYEPALAHLRTVPEMRPLAEKVTIAPFEFGQNVYQKLLESIVSQQLSVKVADVIFGRFVALFPDQNPKSELLLATDTETLRGVGLSYQKAGYLKNVAQFSLENDLETRDWAAMTDEEIVQFLIQIKGVGRWTVEMLLMFTLGRPDILPVDDLGIQQGFQKLYALEETGKDLKKRMVEIAEAWRPHRTVGSRLLWRWKDTL